MAVADPIKETTPEAVKALKAAGVSVVMLITGDSREPAEAVGHQLPIAAGVLYPLLGILLSPVIACAAMAMSSVSVVRSALRLKRVVL